MEEEFFNKAYFEDFFISHLAYKKGGGKDKIQPLVYWRVYRNEIDTVIDKCLTGKYEFCPYNEHLISKGSQSLPRVISIPIVRDRLVLGVLNQYLSKLFPHCVNHKTPNTYIKEIQKYIEEHRKYSLQFFKSDFTKFYDNINQHLLFEKLQKKIDNKNIFQLIVKAVQTPTFSGPKSKREPNAKNIKGVPQGLAISNLLASIYMYDFDEYMLNLTRGGLYIRYVDDILILHNKTENIKEKISDYIIQKNLQLQFSEKKTIEQGNLKESNVDYIGFLISDKLITPRAKNVDSFLNRLATKCTKFKKLYEDKHLRPLFIFKDVDLISYYVEDLNWMISGIKVDNNLYGWMPYFQATNDLSLLCRIDSIVRKKLLKGFDDTVKNQVHSLLKSYYSIIERNGNKLAFDFDKIESPDQKRHFLARRGRLYAERKYTNQQIDLIFQSYKESIKRKTQKNIGYSKM